MSTSRSPERAIGTPPSQSVSSFPSAPSSPSSFPSNLSQTSPLKASSSLYFSSTSSSHNLPTITFTPIDPSYRSSTSFQPLFKTSHILTVAEFIWPSPSSASAEIRLVNYRFYVTGLRSGLGVTHNGSSLFRRSRLRRPMQLAHGDIIAFSTSRGDSACPLQLRVCFDTIDLTEQESHVLQQSLPSRIDCVEPPRRASLRRNSTALGSSRKDLPDWHSKASYQRTPATTLASVSTTGPSSKTYRAVNSCSNYGQHPSSALLSADPPSPGLFLSTAQELEPKRHDPNIVEVPVSDFDSMTAAHVISDRGATTSSEGRIRSALLALHRVGMAIQASIASRAFASIAARRPSASTGASPSESAIALKPDQRASGGVAHASPSLDAPQPVNDTVLASAFVALNRVRTAMFQLRSDVDITTTRPSFSGRTSSTPRSAAFNFHRPGETATPLLSVRATQRNTSILTNTGPSCALCGRLATGVLSVGLQSIPLLARLFSFHHPCSKDVRFWPSFPGH
ncbi:unnamed protein product [Tilletia controversa]|nr:unnamed protein product [Tilletia controversa]